MKAARVSDHGGPEKITIEEIPRPAPKSGEALVQVYSAGVNPIDWKIRKYTMPGRTVTFPYTSGLDFAGIVTEVDPGIDKSIIGQEVFGNSPGAHAEYVTAPVQALHKKPKNITFDQAATIPIGGRTAWIALFILGELREKQKVLVHGAAGGVGGYAVQLAHWKKAQVSGTVSEKNMDYIKMLGADKAIDYNASRFEKLVHDVDIVVDAIGGEVEDRSWQVLKKGGILISLTRPPDMAKAKTFGVRAASTNMTPDLQAKIKIDPLAEIAKVIEAGKVVPQVGRVFSLNEARQAQELCESGHGRGRIVIHVID